MKSFQELIRHEGNRDLFRAVEMSVAAMASGYPFHIHTEGLRGTGKTTILRAAKSILPPIIRIKHCQYNCDPAKPHCPEHRHLSPAEIAAIGTEQVPCPFLEISHGAKISTTVGSIDLAKLTDPLQPTAALLPGTIPQAHRGIIFLDEINRLADASPEIADVLLDVMGTKPGRIQIEEAGLPTVEMPVRVSVWAASNPDEEPGSLAQIRKQLSDRFDLAVSMGRPSEVQSVIDILASKERTNAAGFSYQAPPAGELNHVTLDDKIRRIFATIYVDFDLESLRSIEAMETAAVLTAILDGRRSILVSDITQIVQLTLGHRADPATIANIIKYLQSNGEVPVPPQSLQTPRDGVKTLHPAATDRQKPLQKNRLRNWWDSLREKLTPKTSAMGTRQAAQQGDRRDDQRQHDGSGAGGSSSVGQQVADPATLTITAPPKPAVPLYQLSVEEFVSTDEKTQTQR